MLFSLGADSTRRLFLQDQLVVSAARRTLRLPLSGRAMLAPLVAFLGHSQQHLVALEAALASLSVGPAFDERMDRQAGKLTRVTVQANLRNPLLVVACLAAIPALVLALA
jgi:hypothetical protein